MAESSGNPSRTRPQRLVLVGFMGAGKTSVGRELARSLEWEFIDLDERIERLEQRSVREIFAREGESYFRTIERDELEKVLQESRNDVIVSVGGGAFAQAGSAERLHQLGAISILLDAPVEELRRRVTAGGQGGAVRPLAQDGERFARLYRDRRDAYARADHRFDTEGKSITRVAREIADWVRASVAKVRS